MRHIPEAIIYTMDGVLTNTSEYHFIAWESLAAELGIHFAEEEFEAIKGLNSIDALDRVLNNGGKKYIFSSQEKLELVTRKNNYYKQFVHFLTPENVSPGVLHFLQAVKDAGIKQGIASANQMTTSILDSLQLSTYFDHIVDVTTITHGKPNGEFYQMASSALQINPEHCIGIEDSQAGIRSIKKNGMYAVGVGSNQTLLSYAGADCVVDSLEKFTFDQLLESYKPTMTPDDL